MNKTVLITGASSGIGYELAKIMGKEGYNLVLTARRKDKLNKLKKEIEKENDVSVLVIAQDLTEEGGAQKIFNICKTKKVRVDVLINNAGFGHSGRFLESDLDKNISMIKLNIVALTQLTKIFLSDIISSNAGKIMNVASVAAFFPGPLMSVYYATKAYVLSFSEALRAELKGIGVSVTTLCPGVTKSGFQKVAYMMSVEEKYGKGMHTAEYVARFGYEMMLKGRGVVIPGFKNKLYIFASRFLPSNKLAEIIYKKHS